ncbi:hypothetical protein [Agaribacterium sp. ZY112]|uniref:hypothetical protein n=1 Tax=Agaribacterium sp. ZY112 TaxID=3233574 RepID=UPI003525D4E5
MNIDNRISNEIRDLICQSEDLLSIDWDCCAFVFDTSDGATSNSGFVYYGEKCIPAIADIENSPLVIDEKIQQLRSVVFKECGDKFKQVLVQIEKESGRSKIDFDFEFEDANRWTIVPPKMKEMRETLRPKF